MGLMGSSLALLPGFLGRGRDLARSGNDHAADRDLFDLAPGAPLCEELPMAPFAADTLRGRRTEPVRMGAALPTALLADAADTGELQLDHKYLL